MQVGDLLGCRTAQFAFTFHVNGCENSTFDSISLLGGPGFGFFAEGTNIPGQRGGNTYRRCSIKRPPRPLGAVEDPLVSTSADGFHMAGVPWGPVIDSCFFEAMCDDGIAIHGSFRVVTVREQLRRRPLLSTIGFTPLPARSPVYYRMPIILRTASGLYPTITFPGTCFAYTMVHSRRLLGPPRAPSRYWQLSRPRPLISLRRMSPTRCPVRRSMQRPDMLW